jgi:hypothetical protein
MFCCDDCRLCAGVVMTMPMRQYRLDKSCHRIELKSVLQGHNKPVRIARRAHFALGQTHHSRYTDSVI